MRLILNSRLQLYLIIYDDKVTKNFKEIYDEGTNYRQYSGKRRASLLENVSPLELSDTRYAAYTLTVEPDLWPMKRDRNMRILQGKTAPEIVKEILHDLQMNVDDQLTENYLVWKYM